MTGFKSGGKTPWSYPAHIFSNFSIQYNFGSISIALLVMSRDVCTSTAANCLTGVQAGWVTGTSNGVSLAGAVVGQMSMGYVGDVIGRSNALLMTNSLALVSAFCSAVFPSGSPENIYSLIILFRFFLGIGLGGIYPLSATKASEDDGSEDGKTVDSTSSAKAFFWQMPGILGPWLMAYIISFNENMSADQKWRFLLGFGCVFSGAAVLCLLMESRYQKMMEDMVPREGNLPGQNKNKKGIGIGTGVGNHEGGTLDIGLDTTDTIDDDNEEGQEEGGSNPGSSDGMDPSNTRRRGGSNTSIGNNDNKSRSVSKQTVSSSGISSLTDSVFSNQAGGGSGERGRSGTANSRSSSFSHRPSLADTLRSEYAEDEHLLSRFAVTGGTWLLFDIVAYGVGLFSGEIIHNIIPASPDVSSATAIQNLTSKSLIVQALGIPATGIAILALPHITLKTMQWCGFLLLGFFLLLFGCTFYTLRDSDPQGLFALYCFVGFFMQFGVNVTSFCLPAALFRKEVRASFNGVAAAMGKTGAVIGAFLFPVIAENIEGGYAIVMVICTLCCITGAALTYNLLTEDMINNKPSQGRDVRDMTLMAEDARSSSNSNSRSKKNKMEMSTELIDSTVSPIAEHVV